MDENININLGVSISVDAFHVILTQCDIHTIMKLYYVIPEMRELLKTHRWLKIVQDISRWYLRSFYDFITIYETTYDTTQWNRHFDHETRIFLKGVDIPRCVKEILNSGRIRNSDFIHNLVIDTKYNTEMKTFLMNDNLTIDLEKLCFRIYLDPSRMGIREYIAFYEFNVFCDEEKKIA